MLISPALMLQWAPTQVCGIPLWLFEPCGTCPCTWTALTALMRGFNGLLEPGGVTAARKWVTGGITVVGEHVRCEENSPAAR